MSDPSNKFRMTCQVLQSYPTDGLHLKLSCSSGAAALYNCKASKQLPAPEVQYQTQRNPY